MCEWVLNLEPLFKQVQSTQSSRQFNKKYYDSTFKDKLLQLKKDNETQSGIEFVDGDDMTFTLSTTEGSSGKPIKICLNLDLVPGHEAKCNPLGEARTDKNMDPYLGPPVGRLSMSFNPCTMLVSN